MAEHESNTNRLSPERLLSHFTGGRIVLYGIIALVVHAVVIFGSDPRQTYFALSPSAKRAYEAKLIEQKEAEAARLAAQQEREQAAAADPNAAAPADPNATGEPNRPLTEQERQMQEHADAPVVKAVTEAADPNEIPDVPDLGISVEDTNP